MRECVGHGGRPGRLTHLDEDVRDVPVDGVRAERQGLGDLLVGQAVGDTPQDLALPLAEEGVRGSSHRRDLSPETLEARCSDGMLESCDLLFAVSPLWSNEADWAQTCSETRDAPEVPVACSHGSQVPVVFAPSY